MDSLINILEKDELIIYTLRKLYKEYGYKKYRMSKFEEYDLYVSNKDFLISQNIITFTDIDGKLMALKPDVTLSIIKNTKDNKNEVTKLYYNENVYRASNASHSFKEIMQVGVECIGEIDSNCICENILLAAKSLSLIKEDYILDISNLGIIEKIIDSFNVTSNLRKSILKAIGEKNKEALYEIDIDDKLREYIKTIISTYGPLYETINKLKDEEFYPLIKEEIDLMTAISDNLMKNGMDKRVRIDFSVINNMNYYNGIAFKGFINGVPGGVLSGGQYDKLMDKMGKKSGAIGFAVYLDMLDRI
ncbi:MAG: ATP phosphoribosyltransferase regulatory subunit [Clostridia bacterium]|nr:ATP phosphoribosyltransferase regulatory subunit [Clostridia bacterium]